MNRQLELWDDNPPAPASVECQDAVENKSETDQSIAAVQATTTTSVRQMFTNPERQIAFADTPHYEWPKPDHDRNTITVDRIRDDIDGPAHRFVIKRHDYVEVFLGTGKVDYGTVVGISHSRSEVRVSFGEGQEGIWFAVGCIYPALPPAIERSKTSVHQSNQVQSLSESSDVAEIVNKRIDHERAYTSLKCVSVVRVGSMEGRARLTSTQQAREFFAQYWQANPGNDQERFVIACLDTKHRVQCVVVITVGTLDASLVHPREVFKPAILEGSSAIVLSHNHPSGDTAPSREDHAVTEQLTEAGKLLGITVLDHIIFGEGTNEAVSIREC